MLVPVNTVRYIAGWEVCKTLTKREIRGRADFLTEKIIEQEFYKIIFEKLTLISPGGCCL